MIALVVALPLSFALPLWGQDDPVPTAGAVDQANTAIDPAATPEVPSAETSNDSEGSPDRVDRYPFLVLGVGIATVLGLIIGLKVNAFLALIIAALVVSLMVGGNAGDRMDAVVTAFGKSAGDVGIVIAMAAIIGKCMLDSGAADRIVRRAVDLTGESRASAGLMISGFILAIPVFFDTVFYLLVPLARSLHRRTNKHYLRYLMAIATGGAITHTLVPPTPGPLLVSATLGVDIGMMIFVGTLVAIPSAIAGLIFSIFVDSVMPIAMRPLGPNSEKHQPLAESQLPSLGLSFLPVLLPLLLIGLGTLATTLADREDRAMLTVADIGDVEGLRTALREGIDSPDATPASRFMTSDAMTDQTRELIATEGPLDATEQQKLVDGLNRLMLGRDIYDADAFNTVPVTEATMQMVASDSIRTKPVDRRRMNRMLLEESFPDLVASHQWYSSMRIFSERTKLWSNASFALLLAALVAIWTLKSVRRLSLRDTGSEVEEALMSGGVIILITAAGGAFGAMLRDAQIGAAIQASFQSASAGGITLLLLAYAIAAVLKIAQGSSTVAMIVAAGMVGAISSGVETGYHPVYLATAVGSGSLFGSWMNDSGFWVFAKMGGLTESESLRSWTLLLLVLSATGLLTTILFSQVIPMMDVGT
jgi:H+/gluconate symporter-like permease